VNGLFWGAESVSAMDLIAANWEAMEVAIARVLRWNENGEVRVRVLVLRLLLLRFGSHSNVEERQRREVLMWRSRV
jgi:hypothetical protein